MIIQGHLVLDPPKLPVPGWLETEGARVVGVEEGSPVGKPDLGGPDCIISPGFIDAHIHLPQIGAIGHDGMELLQWLDRVIYPTEVRWKDSDHAVRQITRAHQRLLRAGTLGYAGYLTSHPHGIELLENALGELPLRAIAGQSLMDRNGHDELISQEIASLGNGSPRFSPGINPRFAIACSDELLAKAGTMARDVDGSQGAFIQTHLAETKAECDLVQQLFPQAAHYTGVYDQFGLLTHRTLLAHGIHLTQAEWELITGRDSVVVHCPTANTFLRSGLFDLDAARDHGVRLGLGSDIAAGPDIDMPHVARAMIETAKVRKMTIAPNAHVPTAGDAWRQITRGNAEALGWADGGRIEPGAAADLLVIRLPFDVDQHVYGRLLYQWVDEFIETRILAGSVW